MPSDPLPQEIFDEIVDWAAQDLPESLSDLSLVSKEFLLKRCQRHIFRNIYLSEPLWLPPGTWKISNKSPSLLKNVRQMTVRDRFPGFKVTETEFNEVLERLPDVEALEIDVSFKPEDWTKYGVFTRWPQLVHLSIRLRDDLPLDLFHGLSQLLELRLKLCPSYHKPVINESGVTALPWKLRALHYHPESDKSYHVHPFWQPQAYTDLRHLSLVMELEKHHHFAFTRLIPMCNNSPLQTLRLRYGREYSSFHLNTVPACLAEAISKGHALPPFDVLRYLYIGLTSHRLQGDVTTSEFSVPRHQPDLVSKLLGATAQPSLEALDLVFSWYISRGKSEQELAQEQLVVPSLGWDVLDSVLSDRARFPQLRVVRVRARLEEFNGFRPTKKYSSDDESEVGGVLREQLLDAFTNAMGSGLFVDVGLENTNTFDRVTKPILGAAWRYMPTRL